MAQESGLNHCPICFAKPFDPCKDHFGRSMYIVHSGRVRRGQVDAQVYHQRDSGTMVMYQPRLCELKAVEAGEYRSRVGGYVKLRFEERKFVFINRATHKIYEEWQARIGQFFWIKLVSREVGDVIYMDFVLCEP